MYYAYYWRSEECRYICLTNDIKSSNIVLYTYWLLLIHVYCIHIEHIAVETYYEKTVENKCNQLKKLYNLHREILYYYYT